jgi:predicted nucleic acid-binding Zn ribbon protein
MTDQSGQGGRRRTGHARPGRRTDGSAEVRRAGANEDEHAYARRRAQQARRRAAQERASFDPAPPGDDEWVVPEEGTDGLRRVGPPQPLGDAVSALVEQRGWAERLRGSSAWTRWDEIVGADLAARCEPVRLAGGILVIRAETQTWAAQLRYLLPHLRANADRILGADTVREIRLIVGTLQGANDPEAEA